VVGAVKRGGEQGKAEKMQGRCGDTEGQKIAQTREGHAQGKKKEQLREGARRE